MYSIRETALPSVGARLALSVLRSGLYMDEEEWFEAMFRKELQTSLHKMVHVPQVEQGKTVVPCEILCRANDATYYIVEEKSPPLVGQSKTSGACPL